MRITENAISRIRMIAATICFLMVSAVGATSMAQDPPPAPCDPEEGDCSQWGAVCCGPQCWIGGEQTDYCVYDGPYDCCK